MKTGKVDEEYIPVPDFECHNKAKIKWFSEDGQSRYTPGGRFAEFNGKRYAVREFYDLPPGFPIVVLDDFGLIILMDKVNPEDCE